jgi:hypothetical protein
MRRLRVEKQKGRRDRSLLEVLPLDPRDPDVVRAKTMDRSGDRQMERTTE